MRPALMPLQKDQSTNPKELWVSDLQRHRDVCVFASTLCRYDLRKGDLFKLGKGATKECFLCDVYRWLWRV